MFEQVGELLLQVAVDQAVGAQFMGLEVVAHGARRAVDLLGLQGVAHAAQLPVDLGAGQARGVGQQAQGVALGLQRLDRPDRTRQPSW
ncbi:hypothetical protein D3C72_2395080 [compost metagenome]